MSAAKEIRNKIKSVKNTQKITKAMEMVAASKMKKAQDRMNSARPYSEKIRLVCAHMTKANPEYQHPYMASSKRAKQDSTTTDKKSIGVLLISTDKGLCGGLNTNVFRLLNQRCQAWSAQGYDIVTGVIGNKGIGFVNRIGYRLEAQGSGLGDKPELSDILGVISRMTTLYLEGEISQLHLVYNKFHNTVKQEPMMEQLIPLHVESLQEGVGKPAAGEEYEDTKLSKDTHAWDYIYEPEAKPVIDLVLQRFIESVIYEAVSENIASEQAARMVAMKAATDNAGNLIDELQLIYNKDRQATITKELSEIVGGAAAV